MLHEPQWSILHRCTQVEMTSLMSLNPETPHVMLQCSDPERVPGALQSLVRRSFRQSGGDAAAALKALSLTGRRLNLLRRLAPAPTSTALTSGVRVTVASSYNITMAHMQTNWAYSFAYQVDISNEGPEALQLVSRSWEILDFNGETQTVAGPGVVGMQPVIQPGGSFRYSSTAGIPTMRGALHIGPRCLWQSWPTSPRCGPC